MSDKFETRIPTSVLEILCDIGILYGFDPLGSAESEQYFIKLVNDYVGDVSDIRSWLESELKEKFKCLGVRPKWIQNPDWQFHANEPMIFVGQIDIQSNREYLHDDTSFYVFWDHKKGEKSVVIQTM